MFKNHLKIALRFFFRQKIYSSINILGLAVGIAATLLILSYVEFELSYDRFQQNAESLCRIGVITKKEGNVLFDGPQFIAAMGPAMQAEFPEVDSYVRLSDFGEMTASSSDRLLRIPHVTYADSSFFELLSFPLVAGDPKRALVQPYSIVLTEQAALGLFGGTDPIGKEVKLNNQNNFVVTGIVKAAPANSHIQFGALVSLSTLYRDPTINAYLGWNGGNRYVAYLKLRPNTRAEDVERKLPNFMWSHINKEYASGGLLLQAYLQPMAKIHLYYESDSKSMGQRLGQIDVLNNFKVRAAIDEFYIARINAGQSGDFDLAGTTFRLKITKVYPEVKDGRFEVDLEFVGPPPQGIRRGQTLQIRLELGDLSEALLIPRGGFYQKTGGQWVYVVDKSGGFAIKRNIKLGRQNPQMFEVLEGLAPGEQVITSTYDNFGDIDKLVLKK